MLHNDAEAQPVGALVMLGGDLPGGAAISRISALAASEPRPLLVAADRGADYLAALGLLPDVIVGDNDSLTGIYPGIARVEYPRGKDFTDGAAALAYAAGHTEGRIAVAGAIGGRLDHLLANLLAPLDILADPRRWLLLGDDFTAVYSSGYCRAEGAAGQTLSLIALSHRVAGIYLQGLEYSLSNAAIRLGSSLTLSNALLGPSAEIRHAEGVLLVIHYDT